MVGRKRRAQIAIIHDRRADAPRHGSVVAVDVDDPYEIGAKIRVLATIRDDPLRWFVSRKWIDAAQYQAGLDWQKYYEASGIGGLKAMDPTKEPVDGKQIPDVLTDRQRIAVKWLGDMAKELGQEGDSLVRDVLGRGLTITQCAAARGMRSDLNSRDVVYLGRRFRECLETMAIKLGYAPRGRAV